MTSRACRRCTKGFLCSGDQGRPPWLPAAPYEVRYEVAKDEGFQKIIRRGSTVALPVEAHSVRVELDDLGPRHQFFYRFKAGDDVSPVGRTRTTPPGNAMVESVTFAFVSCQNFPDGYFTLQRQLSCLAVV